MFWKTNRNVISSTSLNSGEQFIFFFLSPFLFSRPIREHLQKFNFQRASESDNWKITLAHALDAEIEIHSLCRTPRNLI